MRNFGVSYQGTFRNEIRTIDTTLIGSIREQLGGTPSINTSNLRDNIKNGISHRIPISTSFKALKWITVSPNVSFDEYWYLETTEKTWDDERDSLITNTVKGFDRAVSYRTSISLSTILYGMKIFKKERKLQAIRHVIRPNMSAVYSLIFRWAKKMAIEMYNQTRLKYSVHIRYTKMVFWDVPHPDHKHL